MNVKKIFLLINFIMLSPALARIETDAPPASNDPKTYLYGIAGYLLANLSVKTITEAFNLANSIKTFLKSNQYIIVPAEGVVSKANPMSSQFCLNMQSEQFKFLVPDVARRPLKIGKIPKEIMNESFFWANRGKITAGTAVLIALGYKYRKKIKTSYIKLSTKVAQKFKRKN